MQLISESNGIHYSTIPMNEELVYKLEREKRTAGYASTESMASRHSDQIKSNECGVGKRDVMDIWVSLITTLMDLDENSFL